MEKFIGKIFIWVFCLPVAISIRCLVALRDITDDYDWDGICETFSVLICICGFVLQVFYLVIMAKFIMGVF